MAFCFITDEEIYFILTTNTHIMQLASHFGQMKAIRCSKMFSDQEYTYNEIYSLHTMKCIVSIYMYVSTMHVWNILSDTCFLKLSF